jgi:hypothetical protein
VKAFYDDGGWFFLMGLE